MKYDKRLTKEQNEIAHTLYMLSKLFVEYTDSEHIISAELDKVRKALTECACNPCYRVGDTQFISQKVLEVLQKTLDKLDNSQVN